jgi:hypothetical protein
VRRTNFLIRSLSGDKRRLERISPFLFGQRNIRNARYLPKDRDLPVAGLELKAFTYDFGFNNPAAVLGPYQETDTNLVIRRNVMIWAIMAHRQPVATGGVMPTEVIPPLLFNVYHQHEDKIFQFFNKPIAHLEGGGVARFPYILKEPQIILSGDQLSVDVTNAGNYNLAVQIVLYGGEFD